jgi:ComF family protein
MLTDFISLIYPNQCYGCGNVLSKQETGVCLSCLSDLPRTNFENDFENPVAKLFWGRVQLVYGLSAFQFNKKGLIQKLMHQLKYNKATVVGEILGKELGEVLHRANYPDRFDAVVSVPLHAKKLRQRGYNQSDVIAQAVSKVIEKPIVFEAIERKIHTTSQTKKGRYARWENVEEIFVATQPQLLAGKHILVVDDVVTTGATLESCCNILLQVPDTRVSIATVASGR